MRNMSFSHTTEQMRSRTHPDKGGEAEAFNAVQTAYDQARDALASMK